MKSFGQNKSELLLLPHNPKQPLLGHLWQPHPYLCLFLFSSAGTERAKYERQVFVNTLRDRVLVINSMTYFIYLCFKNVWCLIADRSLVCFGILRAVLAVSRFQLKAFFSSQNSEKDKLALSIITYIGCGLSTAALAITLIVLLSIE